MSLQDRDRLGITADLVRISAGIEGAQDLVGDFAQALDKANV
jgi:cystathionine beta-lyase/cystathionine gamma-synthase